MQYIFRIIIVLLVGIVLFNHNLDGQNQYTSSSKKAIKYYEEGISKLRLYNYNEAISLFNEAINADNKFIEAYLVLAEIYIELNEHEKAVETYNKGLPINPDFFPTGYYLLAESEVKLGLYNEAIKHIEIALFSKKINDITTSKAMATLKNCEFAIQAMNDPVPFEPVNLGPSINTKNDEYWPSLSADEQTLVITVLMPKDPNNPEKFHNRQEDFYFSEKTDDKWMPVKSLGKPLNTKDNEGAQSLSADGKLMIFTACNRADGQGSCDLYFSMKLGSKWEIPINMNRPVNTNKKETQPSLSRDSQTLYFVSDRSGGKGGLDIWMSKWKPEGHWGQPVNLGDTINTPGDEQSPFIHADNQTLYFASNGRTGMGGFDLYMSVCDENGKWSDPKNLGYPINTYGDEVGLYVNARGNKAYFSSDRIPEMGKDIFEFELYPEIQPLLVSYMKGKVYDANTKLPLKAKFQLIDLASAKTTIESYSDKTNGEFLVCIPTNKDFALNVSKTGYLFFSEHFALKEISHNTRPFIKDVPLRPIQIGERIILKNIFYETDSYELKKKSLAELYKIIDFLSDNPEVEIEIGGHTDNVGADVYNQELSVKRAQSVYLYLIQHDVPKERLSYKGYGKTMPIASNQTSKGRAQNRRTEFMITSK